MPMPNPLDFLHKSSTTPARGGPDGGRTGTTNKATRSTTTYSQHLKDPNCADHGLLLSQKCVYERQLPGESYITAHMTRLQHGYYDSPFVHGDRMDSVRFVALKFVFHPADTRHRFVSARISLAIHEKGNRPAGVLPLPPQLGRPSKQQPSVDKSNKRKPKFLRHAPRLLYGTLSPETLDWTFNLAGSLGVAQGPASASINPEYGVKSSYKVYKMMKIQGSLRTLHSWYGQQHDVEDGEIVWTLEENSLQKSGLPREFTFVILLTKGDVRDVAFEIDIDPVVGSWYGTYPKWWLSRIWYQPMQKEPISLDKELGQVFGPSTKEEGYNFANLMGSFDDFVALPGTTYTKAEPPAPDAGASNGATADQKDKRQLTASPEPSEPKNFNINLYVKGYQSSRASSASVTPITNTSRLALQAQPTSPLPATGFSISRSRNHRRRNSEVPHMPSPLAQNPTSPRQRPVSGIYEVSATPATPASPPATHHHAQRPRRFSDQTDISDDLFTDPYVTDNPKTPSQPSRHLRHPRSGSGLRAQFDTGQAPASIQEQDDPPRPRSRERNRLTSPPSRNEKEVKANRRHSIQVPPTASASTTPPHAPQPLTSPRKRNPAARHSINSSTVFSPRDFDQLIPHHSLATTEPSTYVNELPSMNNIPSFPPSSYPVYAPTRAVDTRSPEPHLEPEPHRYHDEEDEPSYAAGPRAPSPPSVDDVGGIVQREVSNYLKAHPELYSPNFGKGSPVNSDSLDMNVGHKGHLGVGKENWGGGRRIPSGGTNGEFVKVNDDGLGYGAWEYLE